MGRCRNWVDDDEDDEDYPSPEPMIGFVIPQSTAEEEPLTCSTHKKYQAKRKPRTLCEACWRMFVERNPL